MARYRPGFGFEDCSLGSLLRLLAIYECALLSDANYPLGSHRRTVTTWRNQVLRELAVR
jgi:hypothetical protein